MRRLLFIPCIALGLAGIGDVHAEPQPTVRLSYLRDASAAACPDEESMRRGVSARLGRQPFAAESPRLLTIHLKAERRGFSAEISVQDEAGAVVGERSLRTKQEDCAELASAMQLAIAIAIDPLHTMPAPPPPENPTPAEPVDPAPASRVEEDSSQWQEASWSPNPPAPPPLVVPGARHTLGVGLSLAASSEPNPTLGLTLHYHSLGRPLSWGVEGRADRTSESTAKSGQVETALWAATFLLCIHPGVFDACALASAGTLRGRGIGYRESNSFSRPYGAGGVRLARAFRVQDNFAIDLGADVLARVNTITLLIDEDEVWTSSPLEVALGARAVWMLQ